MREAIGAAHSSGELLRQFASTAPCSDRTSSASVLIGMGVGARNGYPGGTLALCEVVAELALYFPRPESEPQPKKCNGGKEEKRRSNGDPSGLWD